MSSSFGQRHWFGAIRGKDQFCQLLARLFRAFDRDQNLALGNVLLVLIVSQKLGKSCIGLHSELFFGINKVSPLRIQKLPSFVLFLLRIEAAVSKTN